MGSLVCRPITIGKDHRERAPPSNRCPPSHEQRHAQRTHTPGTKAQSAGLERAKAEAIQQAAGSRQQAAGSKCVMAARVLLKL